MKPKQEPEETRRHDTKIRRKQDKTNAAREERTGQGTKTPKQDKGKTPANKTKTNKSQDTNTPETDVDLGGKA
jgi:hypothetical protein